MAIFKINETKPAVVTYAYIVQAESYEQAIEKIENGEVEGDYLGMEIDYEIDSNYSLAKEK